MTKLVVVLAAVVVVILVVVIVAARNMRAEDPDEFADGPDHRDMSRGGPDGREAPYDREPAMRAPGRAARGPAARGPDAQRGLMADSPTRNGRSGSNGRRDEPARAQRAQPEMSASGYDDHLSGPLPVVPAAGPRRRPESSAARDGRTGPQRRPEQAEAPAPARPRSRRSSDTSQWDSSDWDKLSDVDYWAELASDKSLTTTAQAAASARPARPAQRPAQRQPAPDPATETQTMSGRASRHGGVPRPDPDSDPTVRSRRPPARGEPSAAGRRADTAAAGPRGGPGGMLPAPPDQHMPRHSGPQSLPGRSAAPAQSGFPGLPGPGTTGPGPGSVPDLPALPPPGSMPGPSSLPDPPPRTAGPPSQPRGVPAGPASAPARSRRRPDPDDDPLTSPSFPRIPGDSRSYRNGRPGNSSRAATSPQQYPAAPTEQFSSYPSAPARPAAHYGATGSRETNGADPYSYQSGAAAVPESYPGTTPAAAAGRPGAAGNPYGSYVTPDSPAPSAAYGGHSPAQGNGSGYLPSAAADNTASADNYWTQQRQGPGAHSAGTPGYLDDPLLGRQSAAPRAGAAPEPGYGYGQQDPAGYGPGGYPAVPGDAAGYQPQDGYRGDEREPGPPRPGRTGYSGYPGYDGSR